jgi:hypothetical protein
LSYIVVQVAGSAVILDVWDLEIDDVNREKLHANGISVATAFEVVGGDPRVLPNRVKGGAPFLLVGPTSIGFVTLPIDETLVHGSWRPRTGYPSKPADRQRYEKAGPKR